MSELKVIGCGLPRTGTNSLQTALQILGFDPCYHMYEVLKDAQRAKDWLGAFEALKKGEKADYDELLKGYKAGVDAPVSEVYLDLVKRDPELKVILTHRPPAEWMKSCEDTILKIMDPVLGVLIYWVPKIYWQRRMVMKGLFPYFDQRYGGFNVDVMERRIAEAKREVPADRLLVFRVQEGWEPLCKFLNVPVPKVPFPRVNDAAAIKKLLLKQVAIGLFRWALVLGAAVGSVRLVLPKIQQQLQ